MDKQLLKAYIRTIVEDEVQKILPEMLSEVISGMTQLSETKNTATPVKSKKSIDRTRLAELLGNPYGGTPAREQMIIPENAGPDANPDVVKAINKDYSALMKAMKIT